MGGVFPGIGKASAVSLAGRDTVDSDRHEVTASHVVRGFETDLKVAVRAALATSCLAPKL